MVSKPHDQKWATTQSCWGRKACPRHCRFGFRTQLRGECRVPSAATEWNRLIKNWASIPGQPWLPGHLMVLYACTYIYNYNCIYSYMYMHACVCIYIYVSYICYICICILIFGVLLVTVTPNPYFAMFLYIFCCLLCQTCLHLLGLCLVNIVALKMMHRQI